MSRYFFHLRDQASELLDPEGIELPSVLASKAVALHSARDSLSHDIRDGLIDLRYRIDVEDISGRPMHSLPFGDAFEVIPALPTSKGAVHDIPSEADPLGESVHVHGPSGLDIGFTPKAALETAKRIGDAAVEVILEHASLSARLCELPGK